jgi:hypothetical protein
MATKQSRVIYQVKISLMGAKPPIWRTVLVASDISLSAFHDVIQVVMGWTNSHLHQFIANKTFYSVPDGDYELETEDETLYTLAQLLTKEKDSLIYEYDFGDSWEHKILLEKILPFDAEIALPVCLKGKRACPPEDCGGIWGYEELIAIVLDPKHSEYEDTLEWLGGEFDPEEFDLDAINEDLTEYFQ